MSDESEHPVRRHFRDRPYVEFASRTVSRMFEVDVDVFFPQLTVFGFLMAKAGALLLALRFIVEGAMNVLNAHVDWSLLSTSPAQFFAEGIDWVLFLSSPAFFSLVAIVLYLTMDQIVEDIHILKEYEESESKDIEIERPLLGLLTGISALFVSTVYKAFSVVVIDARAVFYMHYSEFPTAVVIDIFYLGLVFFALGTIAQSLTVLLRSSRDLA